MMADIKIISMGLGGLKYVTSEAMNTLLESEILIGAERFKDLLPDREILVPEKIVGGTISLIRKHEGKKTSVLVTGDAGFYSLAKSVIKEFGKESVEVIPGISVVQLAFARLAEPWDNLFMLSVHGREQTDFKILRDKDKFILLCDNKLTAKTAVKELLDMTFTHEITVMENLAMEDENIINVQTKDEIQMLIGASLGIIIGIRRNHE